MSKRTRWTPMDKSTTPFPTLRDAFRVYNQTTGKSPHTIRWYEFRLELFERWLGDGATLADVTVANARAYIADLQGRTERHSNNPYIKQRAGGLSTAYISGFARALRAFSSWLYEDGYSDSNVLSVLRPPKIHQKAIEVLSDDEVRRLLSVIDQKSPIGIRNHAMIFTLLDCGLRASELCTLELEGAHLDQGYLRILGKGAKERLVPIGRRCQETLLRWRNHYRSGFLAEESRFLFVSVSGEPITVSALEKVVTVTGKAAAIDRVHCHLLRHTFATTFLVKEVGDALRLQQLLGHSSLEMTRRYVSMANVQQSLIEQRNTPMDLLDADRTRRRGNKSRPRTPLRLLK